MASKWYELTYISGWTHKVEKCIVTSAHPKQYGWDKFTYAIFGREIGSNVAIAPHEVEVGRRELDKDEAKYWESRVVYQCREIHENFKEVYC
jgi:hypothetical protein